MLNLLFVRETRDVKLQDLDHSEVELAFTAGLQKALADGPSGGLGRASQLNPNQKLCRVTTTRITATLIQSCMQTLVAKLSAKTSARTVGSPPKSKTCFCAGLIFLQGKRSSTLPVVQEVQPGGSLHLPAVVSWGSTSTNRPVPRQSRLHLSATSKSRRNFALRTRESHCHSLMRASMRLPVLMPSITFLIGRS